MITPPKKIEKRTKNKNEDALGSIISESKGILSERCFPQGKQWKTYKVLNQPKSYPGSGSSELPFPRFVLIWLCPWPGFDFPKIQPPGVLRRVGVPKRKAKEVMNLGCESLAAAGFPQPAWCSWAEFHTYENVWKDREIREKDNGL